MQTTLNIVLVSHINSDDGNVIVRVRRAVLRMIDVVIDMSLGWPMIAKAEIESPLRMMDIREYDRKNSENFIESRVSLYPNW